MLQLCAVGSKGSKGAVHEGLAYWRCGGEGVGVVVLQGGCLLMQRQSVVIVGGGQRIQQLQMMRGDVAEERLLRWELSKP